MVGIALRGAAGAAGSGALAGSGAGAGAAGSGALAGSGAGAGLASSTTSGAAIGVASTASTGAFSDFDWASLSFCIKNFCFL